jgi:hypothetical protein
VGESEGEATMELADDEAEVAVRLTAGLLFGSAEVVAIVNERFNIYAEINSGGFEEVDEVF